MRGLVPGLPSPNPLGHALPALYQGDELTQDFTAALDEVLAPVLSVLDNLDAYLDPRLAPMDFVRWLAGWVGLELDENWPEKRQRDFVAEAAEIYRWRGTKRGLAAQVKLYVGTEPTIMDSGGVTWSAAPNGKLPGNGKPTMKVTVRVEDPSSVDLSRLDRLVAEAKPAHVLHEVEVVNT